MRDFFNKFFSNNRHQADPNSPDNAPDGEASEAEDIFNELMYCPAEDELLYHYCDPNAFLNITNKKELWFSDVFTMNDYSEMHYGYSIFEEAVSSLLNEIPKEFFNQIDGRIHSTGMVMLPLICCFSRDGDVLSQWRAYAQDGEGYAIGFSAKELCNLPARPLKVLYNREQQIKKTTAWLRAIYDIEKDAEFTFGLDFQAQVSFFAMDLCALKNPGFREELEVRFVHSLNIDYEDEKGKFADYGGIAWGKPVAGSEVKFRMRKSVPVTYIEQDFSNSKKAHPVKRVVLGPKNESRLTGINLYLETTGLTGVEVTRSETSYG